MRPDDNLADAVKSVLSSPVETVRAYLDWVNLKHQKKIQSQVDSVRNRDREWQNATNPNVPTTNYVGDELGGRSVGDVQRDTSKAAYEWALQHGRDLPQYEPTAPIDYEELQKAVDYTNTRSPNSYKFDQGSPYYDRDADMYRQLADSLKGGPKYDNGAFDRGVEYLKRMLGR